MRRIKLFEDFVFKEQLCLCLCFFIFSLIFVDRNNGSNSDGMKLPLVFENGGVTITPVVSTTSAAIVTASNNHNMHHSSLQHSKSQNLLSHLLQHRDIGNGKGDMATIEPVRDLNRTKS